MGHDGGHSGVNPPGRVPPFLGQPGPSGVLADYGVADVAVQLTIAEADFWRQQRALPGRVKMLRPCGAAFGRP